MLDILDNVLIENVDIEKNILGDRSKEGKMTIQVKEVTKSYSDNMSLDINDSDNNSHKSFCI